MKTAGIKIPDSIRDAIRDEYLTSDISQLQLAQRYGISKSVVWSIIHEFDNGDSCTTDIRNKQLGSK